MIGTQQQGSILRVNYTDSYIAPLTTQASLDWYYGRVVPGKRRYVVRELSEKYHVDPTRYFFGIVNQKISTVDLVYAMSWEPASKYGVTDDRRFRWVLHLSEIGKLTIPILAPYCRSYTYNCLDIMLNGQGKSLHELTVRRNQRMQQFPFH